MAAGWQVAATGPFSPVWELVAVPRSHATLPYTLTHIHTPYTAAEAPPPPPLQPPYHPQGHEPMARERGGGACLYNPAAAPLTSSVTARSLSLAQLPLPLHLHLFLSVSTNLHKMAPVCVVPLDYTSELPISRTVQYKKVNTHFRTVQSTLQFRKFRPVLNRHLIFN